MPLSNAEGLAQRKAFVGSYAVSWPLHLGCHKAVCCETDLRAVLNSFD